MQVAPACWTPSSAQQEVTVACRNANLLCFPHFRLLRLRSATAPEGPLDGGWREGAPSGFANRLDDATGLCNARDASDQASTRPARALAPAFRPAKLSAAQLHAELL